MKTMTSIFNHILWKQQWKCPISF